MRDFESELRSETGRDGLVFDSVPHPGCPEWTDAHVDAVLGDVISPLAWTLVGPAFEWSQARMWAAFGVVPPTRDRRARFTARLQGRLLVGLTTLRHAAARFPGVDPERTERELGIPQSSTPKTWRDRAWYPAAAVGVSTTTARAPMWVLRERRLVRSSAKQLARLDAAGPDALIQSIERSRRLLVPVLQAHAFLRMATHASIDRLRSHADDDELAFGLLADLPDLEASQPSLALLRIAHSVRRTGRIDEVEIDWFLDRYGHRGVNELDPTAPVWAGQRDALEAVVVRMAADDIDDPSVASTRTYAAAGKRLARLGRLHRAQITADAIAARRLSVLGERSKSDAARHVHVMRQLVGRLRAGIDVDPELQAMLSWDELIQLATARTRVDADLQQRQRELDVRARPSARPSLAIRRYAVLTGVAASSGCAEGTAVVVHDPSVDDLDGDILVAHATDTAWTPLFLGRAGVVTDTGGVLSHSSIVARDLGIPAVVGTGTATQVIRSGDVTRVNGDDGVVEIVAT